VSAGTWIDRVGQDAGRTGSLAAPARWSTCTTSWFRSSR